MKKPYSKPLDPAIEAFVRALARQDARRAFERKFGKKNETEAANTPVFEKYTTQRDVRIRHENTDGTIIHYTPAKQDPQPSTADMMHKAIRAARICEFRRRMKFLRWECLLPRDNGKRRRK